jgi:enoyl-CoA hydratase/carnithine racemase
MNALDVATKEAIGATFLELDQRRKEIKVVIIHGAGERDFAAGPEIKAFLKLNLETTKLK